LTGSRKVRCHPAKWLSRVHGNITLFFADWLLFPPVRGALQKSGIYIRTFMIDGSFLGI
jgi:hypothetical protein